MKSNKIGAVAAGLLCLVAAHAGPSWGQVGFGAGQSLDAKEALAEAGSFKVPDVLRVILAGYVIANDPAAGKPGQAVEWVSISGGKFTMGTDDGSEDFKDAKPIHEVTIKAFEMSKTLVTVEQYAECVIKGGCTEPATGGLCNWGKANRQRDPINCVDWNQANQYAKFKGARLPSESEYEYAATSGGKNQKYPWGNEEATCDRAVMHGNGGDGCGSGSTMPVCSKPAGNAKVSGGELCDMAGNVWEFTQDTWHSSYAGAPTDGSAWVEGAPSYLMRGGSFDLRGAMYLRADYRGDFYPGTRYYNGSYFWHFSIGFRLARSSR